MSNLNLWNKVKQPPKSALKTIGAGRLKGMTDINPQWRLEAITEHFGPCGIGWYYEIVKMWTEAGAGGELMCFVHVHLFTLDNSEVVDVGRKGWSRPIVGIGGSALVAKESAGLRANDEGYKMALTDALSVAMKQLGFAADIYAGRYDGSKYKDEAPKQTSNDNYDGNGKVKPGNVTPSIAVQEWDKLDEEAKQFLTDIAVDIIAAIDATDIETAHGLFYKNNLDHDEQVALWSRLDSKKRSTIKAFQDKLMNGTLPQ
jgi:hypothetical protein